MTRIARTASVLAVFVLAACGEGASPSPASSVAGSAAPPSAAASQPASPSVAASTAASPAAAAPCAQGAAGAAAAVQVRIAGFTYSPQTVEAKVGDVIEWTNEDGAPHTATLEDGSCATDTIAAGSTGSLVFTVPGTYTYKCAIHPAQMNGFKIVVT